MKKYVILAETGSDIPRDLADYYRIYIVPMYATFGEEMTCVFVSLKTRDVKGAMLGGAISGLPFDTGVGGREI